MAAEQVQGVIVFFSYAKRDKILRDRLEEHLSNLKYKGLIQTWHDRDILAGSDWLEQIDISLHNSQIILLLISSTFMASDYCYSKEMQQALQLHAQKKATVIPILLRPVLYTGAPFARLSILPTNGKPVTTWRDRDSAFVDVALNIEKVAMFYVQNRPADQPTPSSQPPSPPVQDLSAGRSAFPVQSQSPSQDSSRAGRTSTPGKCPFCSAETRPGDNFCLNCGNHLHPSTPSPQAPAAPIESMMPAPSGWAAPAPQYPNPGSAWNNSDLLTIATDSPDNSMMRAGATAMIPQAPPALKNKIEKPAHLILRIDNNENVQQYVLDKPEMSIGRAPGSDILLSKDKLTSRRHATILYENGQYSIRDERSVNGTFVNSQQLDESSERLLQHGDHIGIGEHELIFQTAYPVVNAIEVESLPSTTYSPPSAEDLTYRTQDDSNLTTSAGNEYASRSIASGVMPEAAAPPEEIDSMSFPEEAIGHSFTELPDQHAQMISEAIRRAYYTESVAAYERVLSQTPSDDEALRGLGKALYALARYNEALDAFKRALQSRETPASYAGLGDALVKRKRYSEAVTAYERACQIDPDVTLDYPAFIHALREIGRADEADRMYARGRDLGFFDDPI